MVLIIIQSSIVLKVTKYMVNIVYCLFKNNQVGKGKIYRGAYLWFFYLDDNEPGGNPFE